MLWEFTPVLPAKGLFAFLFALGFPDIFLKGTERTEVKCIISVSVNLSGDFVVELELFVYRAVQVAEELEIMLQC